MPKRPAEPERLEWLMVDGSSLIFRAFYGVPQTIKGPSGIPVNGIRGFLDYLSRFIVERRPRRLVVATDEDWRPQFRVDVLETYKSHRTAEPIPPDLIPQMDPIMEVLAAVGIPALGAKGFEAEDVIATVVKKVGWGPSIEILSGDRDLFALVRDPNVVVLYPERRGEFSIIDESEITRRYDIPGRLYGDFAILRGDPSDGLPGLPGVGAKKAAAMLRRHGSIEGVLWDGNITKEDASYIKKAISVVAPVETIPLELPDATVPAEPAHPAMLARLKQDYGLGGAVDRLLKAMAGQPAA
jgi:5'-3' exonuclease